MIGNRLATLGEDTGVGRVRLRIHIKGSGYFFLRGRGGLTDRLTDKPYQQKIPGLIAIANVKESCNAWWPSLLWLFYHHL